MIMGNIHNMTKARPPYLLWIIAILLLVEAIGTSILVPQYSILFEGLDAELPILTKAVLMGALWFWMVPFVAFAVITFAPKTKSLTVTTAIVLLFVGVLWVPVAIYGLYLPIWEMAEVNPS